ncbi:MAG: hypothetical protein KBG47_05995 [Bacteroidia bacterium]|jgi:Ni/Co efflux regulator RcnB|nr:hypothetical protein [Bacteroidia bacterium]
MKKLVFTIAAVAAFSFANAQEQLQQPAQTPTKKPNETTTTPVKKEAVAVDAPVGTEQSNTVPASTNKGSKTAVDPKKSGTRMAINEKGLPGEKKSKKGTTTNTPK